MLSAPCTSQRHSLLASSETVGKVHRFKVTSLTTRTSISYRLCLCYASTVTAKGGSTVVGESEQEGPAVDQVQDVVVVGAGICGLTAALALKT